MRPFAIGLYLTVGAAMVVAGVSFLFGIVGALFNESSNALAHLAYWLQNLACGRRED
jgi:hypothetical protein